MFKLLSAINSGIATGGMLQITESTTLFAYR